MTLQLSQALETSSMSSGSRTGSRTGSHAGSRAGSSIGGNSRGPSPVSLRDSPSNYMNFADVSLPEELGDSGLNNKQIPDGMVLSNSNVNRRHLDGLDKPTIRNDYSSGSPVTNNNMGKYGSNVSPSNQEFLVEHLASFPQDNKSGFVTPAESLAKLKKISSDGGIWAQKMNMNISKETLRMENGETMELIEEYPMEQINLCIIILNDNMYENLLVFATNASQDKVGAVHLFQCKLDEANLIANAINKKRENVSTPVMNGASEPDIAPPRETRTQYNLEKKHIVAKAVQAFQNYSAAEKIHTTGDQPKPDSNEHISQLQDAKITRDVEILNKCIEEIENFVVMLKRINEARKQLQAKKGKGSKKKKVEDILCLQSQPPPDHRILDVYQKFKHALNLLGKLQPHISDPSSPELIHYLFIPLGIIVKVTGLEKARDVGDPLLTTTCVDLLSDCLDSKEYLFWQTLGPKWTLTKTSEPYKSQYIQPYIPVFVDGWVPPEVILNEKHEAAAKTTAAIVARMQSHKSSGDVNHPTVIHAAMKFKESLVEKDTKVHRSNSGGGIPNVNTSEMQNQQPQRNNSFNGAQTQQRLVGIVVYSYLAHNNRELTIHAGEKVIILENTRRWWLVQNDHGEKGFVPSTVLEIPSPESAQYIDTVDNPPRHTVENPPRGYSPNVESYHPYQTAAVQIATKRDSKSDSPVDSNQNYVNENNMPPSMVPVNKITPVVISVKVPDNYNPILERRSNSPQIIGPPSAVVVKKQESPLPVLTLASIQDDDERVGTAVIRTVTTEGPGKRISPKPDLNSPRTPPILNSPRTPPILNSTRTPPILNIPPPPVPPPPPIMQPPPPIMQPPPPIMQPPPPFVQPPVVSPKPQVNGTKELNSLQRLEQQQGGNLQDELKHRLSLVAPQEEVDQSLPNIDSVDVFIPLYKSSTADDVSRWLYKLGFSQRSIAILKGKTAADLFKMDKETMIDTMGVDEGSQLYEELQVQNGAQSRNKTLTEFQRALVRRLQKRETQNEHTRIDSKKGVADTKTFQEQSAVIRKQKEELDRLKQEQGARDPGSATFTSFRSDSVTSNTLSEKSEL